MSTAIQEAKLRNGFTLPQDCYEHVMRITPELAEKMLAYNFNNRKLRRSLVDYLKAQIEAGEWQKDHPQPIVFSKNRLIDGQNRLTAIKESGIPVHIKTVFGVRDELRQYIDTGISRTLDDRIALIDENPIWNKVACQIITLHFFMKKGNGNPAKTRKTTPHEAEQYFLRHEESIRFCASRNTRKRGIGRIPFWYTFHRFFEKNPNKISELVTAFMMVKGGDINQSQYLREYALRNDVQYCGGGYQVCLEICERTAYACQTYLAGKTINRLLRAKLTQED